MSRLLCQQQVSSIGDRPCLSDQQVMSLISLCAAVYKARTGSGHCYHAALPCPGSAGGVVSTASIPGVYQYKALIPSHEREGATPTRISPRHPSRHSRLLVSLALCNTRETERD